MKNIGLVIALIISGGIVGAATAVYYYWSQATRLPAWYSTQDVVVPTEETIEAARDRVTQRLTIASDRAEVDEALDSAEFNELMMTAIADNSSYSPLLAGAKGFNTTIEGDQLRTGAVVNLADISPNQLQPREREFLQRLTDTFPDLVDREIYVGLEGQPTVANDVLMLDDSTTIQIGELKFPLAEVANRLGISEQELRHGITVGLGVGGVDISEIEFSGDRALVRGAAQ
ncbi:hypothetical protein IQ268_00585 [Oculatella sp. LEGE 06141]|uniref:hypothetical protein n=1 Tax=Oculatella sp. LEGE 06141 TaxID=1828648 RepID=UPI001882FA76|nr:hypothetical protein [Oculatella sp. LEGE 06141]MBE9177070.1 hypothetical protein [Oculatella sp. LEGE 06141]